LQLFLFMPSLTIIIPAKNEEHFLPILLASLHKQTLQPTEIIVADAGSTDRTRAIARSFGVQIIKGGMPGFARNAGARSAQGEILFFFDADVWLPDEHFLEYAMQEFTERHLDIATADVQLEEGKKYDKMTHALYNKYVRLLGDIHPHAPGFCIMVRKSLHERISGFDESITFCEDHDYAARAAKKGSFGFLDSVRIAVTVRRQERDGRLNVLLKYILAEVHLFLLGPIRHNRFHYSFGHPPKEPVQPKKAGVKKNSEEI
jgi:glycosyltransferase involved in cell wall biosynthesis